MSPQPAPEPPHLPRCDSRQRPSEAVHRERPEVAGEYEFHAPSALGTDLIATLVLSTDDIWQLANVDGAFESGGTNHVEDEVHARMHSFGQRVTDFVREARDSDDLLIAIDIVLAEDCYLRPTTTGKVLASEHPVDTTRIAVA